MTSRSHNTLLLWGLVPLFALTPFWSNIVRAQTSGAFADYVFREFGLPPEVPTGQLSDELRTAMQVAFGDSFAQSSWDNAQTAALATIVASNDPRLVWVISDIKMGGLPRGLPRLWNG